jgi:hypothetical protein
LFTKSVNDYFLLPANGKTAAENRKCGIVPIRRTPKAPGKIPLTGTNTICRQKAGNIKKHLKIQNGSPTPRTQAVPRKGINPVNARRFNQYTIIARYRQYPG